jgi:hypothetical protein
MDIRNLFRSETLDDMKVGANAAHFASVDLIEGPDGKLGFVAQDAEGRRVCQQCGGHLLGANHYDRKLRMVPVYMYPDAPAVWLHAKCEAPPIKIFQNFKGLGIRRKVANIVKATSGILGG